MVSADLISCFYISFQNDSLAKQVKGLKAKNNELIREHIEMVKDKNSFGIQLQNQKLDIKRLTSLQSIQAAKALTESSSLKSQLDERCRHSSLFPKATMAQPSLQAAAERRMSSFFAINQLSDELAQVTIRSLNIENIEPCQSPQIYDAVSMPNSSVAEKSVDLGKTIRDPQERECASGIRPELQMRAAEHENGRQTGKAKSLTSKNIVRSELTETSLRKENSMQSCDEGAQGKSSRPRSQVNYKEARNDAECVKKIMFAITRYYLQLSLNSKLRQGDDHTLKAQRTFQPTRGSNARDKTALKSDSSVDY
jgi:hypothetical protein